MNVQDLSPTANNPAENVLERRAILVAGWGRSGTSALARVLNLCGATLPNRLLPPGPDNETGFWEPAEVVRILEEAFESVGASWRDVAEFPRAWFGSEVSGQFRRRLVAALREDYGDSPLFVVKHPLIGHLVPLWLAALEELGTTPLFVIPVRNPLAVAASFRKRDGFEDAHTLQLWLRHYLAAERDTRGSKRVFITYEHLLNDWRSTVHRIGRRLGVEWPRPFCEGEVESFLSPARQHHRFTPQDVYARPEVAPWVKTLFDWTSRAASDLPANSQELDAVHSELRAADVAFIPLLVASYAGQQRLSAEHRDLQARLEATSRELGESDQRTRALEAKYAEAIRILISALNREQRRLDSISPLIPQNGQTVPLSCEEIDANSLLPEDLRLLLARNDESIQRLEATLTQINGSHGWRALQRYHGLRDRILPEGSRRRNVLRLVWRGIASNQRQTSPEVSEIRSRSKASVPGRIAEKQG